MNLCYSMQYICPVAKIKRDCGKHSGVFGKSVSKASHAPFLSRHFFVFSIIRGELKKHLLKNQSFRNFKHYRQNTNRGTISFLCLRLFPKKWFKVYSFENVRKPCSENTFIKIMHNKFKKISEFALIIFIEMPFC